VRSDWPQTVANCSRIGVIAPLINSTGRFKGVLLG